MAKRALLAVGAAALLLAACAPATSAGPNAAAVTSAASASSAAAALVTASAAALGGVETSPGMTTSAGGQANAATTRLSASNSGATSAASSGRATLSFATGTIGSTTTGNLAVTSALSSASASTAVVAATTAATALQVTDPTTWSGASVGVQAGTTLTLALPAPSAADSGAPPSVRMSTGATVTVASLPDGGAVIAAAIPPGAAGSATLTFRWPDGAEGRLQLAIGGAVTLAGGLGNPDDLVVAPDGSVVYTDLASNTVQQILAGGARRTLISGLNVPEGLAVMGADTLLLADQGTDRVFQWTAPSSLRLLRQLAPVRGAEGIDGLSVAVVGGQPTALLPDSPNGRLLFLPVNTLVPTTFAGSWQRPTDAVVANGQLYVVDEYGGRLWRGPLQGPLQPVGPSLSLPDDAAVNSAGVAFVNALGSGTTGGRIERIGPDGRGSAVLTGLNDPQGIDLDGAGNVMFTESGAGRIAAAIQSCLPVLVGFGSVTVHAGGPARVVLVGSDCAAGTPTFALATGALWPAAGHAWSATGAQTLTLANGVQASLTGRGGAALVTLQPPAAHAPGAATLAVQMRVGGQSVARQVVVTLSR